jgi:UDP-N-acetylmuramate dehydrogenase
VILEVTFKLTTKNHIIKTEYGAIKSELENLGIENPTIQDVSKAVINIRQSKLPDPKKQEMQEAFSKTLRFL